MSKGRTYARGPACQPGARPIHPSPTSVLARTAIAADLEDPPGGGDMGQKGAHARTHNHKQSARYANTVFQTGSGGQPADRADNGPKLPSFSLAKGDKKKEPRQKTPGAPLSSGSVLKVCLSSEPLKGRLSKIS